MSIFAAAKIINVYYRGGTELERYKNYLHPPRKYKFPIRYAQADLKNNCTN